MSNEALIKEIDAAVDAHGLWKMRLTTAINTGSSEVPPEQIACDDKCAFGKWLYGPTIDAQTKTGKPYQVIKRLHADFHQSASKIAQMAEDGRKGEAFSMMDSEYAVRTDKLNRALQKWRGELTR